MNRLLTPWMIRCLLSLVLFGAFSGIYAQPAFVSTSNTGDGGIDRDITSNVPLNEINIHAFRDFQKKFKTASGVAWWKNVQGYMVSFMKDSRRNQAYYDPRGAFLYSLSYYSGDAVGSDPGVLVQKRYPAYRITVVTEITDGENIFYLVSIENTASVKTLIVHDGEITVYKDLVNGG
jgi:hypothetical protein